MRGYATILAYVRGTGQTQEASATTTVDHADVTAPSRRHEKDHTDHTDHADHTDRADHRADHTDHADHTRNLSIYLSIYLP